MRCSSLSFALQSAQIRTPLIGTRLKQPELVYGNLLFLMQGNYFYRRLFTSHNPGVIEFLPACSDKLPKGLIV
ncbi:hypothetical protein [Novipirellula rosea]|uniref:hypothetical protein n=1 Tax=Novipirellula rosea TaxID=1031540 RepID=UPI0031EE985F